MGINNGDVMLWLQIFWPRSLYCDFWLIYFFINKRILTKTPYLRLSFIESHYLTSSKCCPLNFIPNNEYLKLRCNLHSKIMENLNNEQVIAFHMSFGEVLSQFWWILATLSTEKIQVTKRRDERKSWNEEERGKEERVDQMLLGK